MEEDEGVEEVCEFVPFKLDKKALKEAFLTAEEDLPGDIEKAEEALKLFLNSKVQAALTKMQEKYGLNLYSCIGTAVILFIKSLFTMESYDIAAAMDALKNAQEVASMLRKEQGFIGSFVGMFANTKDGHFKSMTPLQRHAEIVYAEASLLKALLTIFTESNVMVVVREGLSIRTGYLIAKNCYRFLRNVYTKEGGAQGLRKYNIDKDFICAVYMNIGIVNLVLSIIPTRVLKFIELLGFSGQREFGMKCLELSGGWPERFIKPIKDLKKRRFKKRKLKEALVMVWEDGTPATLGGRQDLSDIFLHLYHIVLAAVIQLPGCNVASSKIVMAKKLEMYPDSFIHRSLQARLLSSERRTPEAISLLDSVIAMQKEWRPLVHICYWEKSLCHAASGQWGEAAGCFDILLEESKWSPAIYTYSKAICLYMIDKNHPDIPQLFARVPKLMKKVAGKSIPLEKFAARKCRKYKEQENRLTLPAYEMLYHWDAFDRIPEEHLDKVMADIDQELEELDKKQTDFRETHPDTENDTPYETFYDDVCLARLFKGIISREKIMPTAQTLMMEDKLLKLKPTPQQVKALDYSIRQFEHIILQGDQIKLDHWILPFCRYELGQLYFRIREYAKAKKEFKASISGGYSDTDHGNQKFKASLESSLHMRAYNALNRIKEIQYLIDTGSYASMTHMLDDPLLAQESQVEMLKDDDDSDRE